jgi:hypothetical protein
MFCTFLEFVNRRERQHDFRKILLSKLGNLADDTISIRSFRPGQVEKAIMSMDGVEEDKKMDLVNFVKQHRDSRLLDVIHQFGGSLGDLASSDGEIAGDDAELPEGEPQPKKPKQQPGQPPAAPEGMGMPAPGGPPPGGMPQM